MSSIVTVNVINGGADIEDFGAFKARYLQVYANPPAGGNQTDYEEWALAVPGVTRAWCNPIGNGPGTVVIYTMWDLVNALHGGFPQGSDGVASSETRDTPATGDQLTVADAIYQLRPVTAVAYSCAPIGLPVDFVLADLGAANTLTNLTAIDVALDAMFLRLGSPLGDSDAIIYPNAWDAAINGVAGVPNFTVVSPVSPIVPGVGYLPQRGTVTARS